MPLGPVGATRGRTGHTSRMDVAAAFGYHLLVRQSATPLLLLLALLLGCPSTVDDDDTTAADDDDATGDDDDATLPDSFDLTVLVQDAIGPIEGASVLQAGGEIQGTTGADGRATLSIDATVEYAVYAVAAMPLRRSAGVEIEAVPSGDLVIDLPLVEVDNPDYTFQPAGLDPLKSTEYCSHCHFEFTEHLQTSAHKGAAKDPQVHDVFAGTAGWIEDEPTCTSVGGRWLPGTLPGGEAGDRCYVGRGLLPDATSTCGGSGQPSCDDPSLAGADQPTVFGACADCHAPGIDGSVGGGHSLLEATGIAYDEGVHCDVCHKVADIDLDAPSGVAGRLVLGRPFEPGWSGGPEWLPAMYGPRADVLNPFMRGVYSPIFNEATFCAGCHEHDQAALLPNQALDSTRWPDGVLPIMSTHTEWSASPNNPTTPCQSCHMLPTDAANGADIDQLNGVDPGIVGGYIRPAGSVRAHTFSGPFGLAASGTSLLEDAAILSLDTAGGADLTVTAEVLNLGAGHAIPTGEPLRSLTVVLEATCDGAPMTQTAGASITEVGGAYAVGVVGETVQVDGADPTLLHWDALDATGDLVVRAVRPTGAFIDYTGPAPFDDAGFSVDQKGLEETTPLGEAAATIAGNDTTLSADLGLQAGDRVFLVEPVVIPDAAGPARAWAGAAGRDFAKVLADAEGALHVPHYAAVDIVRDNRIPSYGTAELSATFAWPQGCTEAEVEARLLYRKYPMGLAMERGWVSEDAIAASASTTQAP